MSEQVQIILQAVGWSVLATILAQLISIFLMRLLGLPPKKLGREINDVQNPAVGAAFFIVALTVGLFVGIFASDGFTRAGELLTEGQNLSAGQEFVINVFWIVFAVLLGLVLMWIGFSVAHRMMGVENEESTYRYIQRELIEEQNAALALFLGGLTVTPFVAVIFQVI